MLQPRWTWLAWATCVVFAACAMAWVTASTLSLEASGREMQRSALLEERVRLALWRMESQATPMLAQQMTLTHQVFATGMPNTSSRPKQQADRNADQTSAKIDVNARFVLERGQYMRWHVEGVGIVPATELASQFRETNDYQTVDPFAPEGSEGEWPNQTAEFESQNEQPPLSQQQAQSREKQLKQAADMARALEPQSIALAVTKPRLAINLADAKPSQTEPFGSTTEGQLAQRETARPSKAYSQGKIGSSKVLSEQAYQQRAQMYVTNQAVTQQALNASNQFEFDNAFAMPGEVSVVWQGGGDWLVVAWPLIHAGDDPAAAAALASRVQGFAISWNALHDHLLVSTQDLLPDARLVRQPDADNWQVERSLVSLPIMIEPGALPDDALPLASMTPTQLSLALAWALLIVAAVAMALLLHGAIALSERRAAFVSAVTHELRTPLTTFRVYTEMLASGMVPDRARQQQYLDTLHHEADRLMHLVENVLAYARLERGRAGDAPQAVDVGDLIDRLEDRATQRCNAAGMSLVIDIPSDSLVAIAGALSVEQVLLNLIDNACKYASDAADRRIHLDAKQTGKHVVISVADHGPGLDGSAGDRWWQPFHKSAEAASETAPGIGLGLALSKRVAANIGGRLEHDQSTSEGARFNLFLPRA